VTEDLDEVLREHADVVAEAREAIESVRKSSEKQLLSTNHVLAKYEKIMKDSLAECGEMLEDDLTRELLPLGWQERRAGWEERQRQQIERLIRLRSEIEATIAELDPRKCSDATVDELIDIIRRATGAPERLN
jgi:hypothetical protein